MVCVADISKVIFTEQKFYKFITILILTIIFEVMTGICVAGIFIDNRNVIKVGFI
jgi:hypothetical protein